MPEAEPLVGQLRARFDPAAALGVPAHVTLLYPFVPPERITGAVLARVRVAIASTCAFRYRLARIERFPGTLYLAPEPAAPFVALTESLARAFPEHPPYRGQFESIVPHLTVAHGSAAERDAAEAQLRASWPPSGAVLARCREIVLIEDSSGRWREMHAFALAPAHDADG